VGVACGDPTVPSSVRNVNRLGVTKNVDAMREYLHRHEATFFTPATDLVLIESQHGRSKRLTQVLSFVAYTWFCERARERGLSWVSVQMVSAKRKTAHLPRRQTCTRPLRKVAVFQDMQTFLKDECHDAELAERIKRHPCRFDISDAIAQAVAWFAAFVPRACVLPLQTLGPAPRRKRTRLAVPVVPLDDADSECEAQEAHLSMRLQPVPFDVDEFVVC
jgi:hypothetical protein